MLFADERAVFWKVDEVIDCCLRTIVASTLQRQVNYYGVCVSSVDPPCIRLVVPQDRMFTSSMITPASPERTRRGSYARDVTGVTVAGARASSHCAEISPVACTYGGTPLM